jgi:hypothetical protein
LCGSSSAEGKGMHNLIVKGRAHSMQPWWTAGLRSPELHETLNTVQIDLGQYCPKSARRSLLWAEGLIGESYQLLQAMLPRRRRCIYKPFGCFRCDMCSCSKFSRFRCTVDCRRKNPPCTTSCLLLGRLKFCQK